MAHSIPDPSSGSSAIASKAASQTRDQTTEQTPEQSPDQTTDQSALAAVKAGLLSAESRPPSVTINKMAEEIFAFLQDFSNYARFFKGVRQVGGSRDGRARWTAGDESSSTEEWQTERLGEERGKWIAWKTVDGGLFSQNGIISLEPATGGRGTTVRMKLMYDGSIARLVGAAGKVVGKDPDAQAYVNLRRLKALLETGEVPTTEGQSSGREDAVTIKH